MAHLEIETIEQILRFDDKTLKIKRVKNLDALVDQIDDRQFSEDERLPYWAELWPAAIGFARFLFKNGALIKDKSVLELGCGLGLTSLALTLPEPASLLVTDYEPDALRVTAQNFKLNNLPLPNFMEADWRSAQLKQRFDVICASDVLYEKRFFKPLLRMLNEYLAPGGMILLAEPGRPIAAPFFEMLSAEGFTFSSVTETVDQDGHDISVRIFKIEKRF